MRTLVWALCVLGIASGAQAQNEPKDSGHHPSTGTESGGLPSATLSISGKVTMGDPAPSFELASSKGTNRSLKSLRGDWVVLVFVPDKNEFPAFEAVVEPLGALPARLVGVTRENAQTLTSLGHRKSVTFEMLGDVTGEVSAAYGLYDSISGRTRPGFLVIDRSGVVQLAVMGQSLPPAQVLALTRFTITGGRD